MSYPITAHSLSPAPPLLNALTQPARALPTVGWAVVSDHAAPEEPVAAAAARVGAALARAACPPAAGGGCSGPHHVSVSSKAVTR